jgi:hypothetical protein
MRWPWPSPLHYAMWKRIRRPGVYQQWMGVVSLQSSAVVHRLLLDAVIVMTILLAMG